MTSLTRRKKALLKHVKSNARNRKSMRGDKDINSLQLPNFNNLNNSGSRRDGFSDKSDSDFSVDIVFGVSTPQNVRIGFNKKPKKNLVRSVHIDSIDQVNLM